MSGAPEATFMHSKCADRIRIWLTSSNAAPGEDDHQQRNRSGVIIERPANINTPTEFRGCQLKKSARPDAFCCHSCLQRSRKPAGVACRAFRGGAGKRLS